MPRIPATRRFISARLTLPGGRTADRGKYRAASAMHNGAPRGFDADGYGAPTYHRRGQAGGGRYWAQPLASGYAGKAIERLWRMSRDATSSTRLRRLTVDRLPRSTSGTAAPTVRPPRSRLTA